MNDKQIVAIMAAILYADPENTQTKEQVVNDAIWLFIHTKWRCETEKIGV